MTSSDHIAGRSSTRSRVSHSRSEGDRDVAALWLLVLPLIGATLVSKLAVPLINVDGIGAGFPLIYLSLLLGMMKGARVQLEPARLLFFCLMASAIGGVMVLRGERISLPSLAFLVLLHLPYVMHVVADSALRDRVQRIFLDLALVIALCGLSQYVLQYMVAPAYLFPIENFLPKSWLVTGFNMQAPIAYGASIYRPNGIFMQEPSFFSQLLAIALLMELIGPARLWRVAIFGVGILASQSGTGIVILAVCLPVLIVAYRRWSFVIAAMVALPLLLLAGPYLHLEQLMARVGEFGSQRSSAYERFVGGFHIFDASMGVDPMRMLFGYGAGTYREIVTELGHPAAEMALFKIVIEYGVVGMLLYFGFMMYCIFSAKAPFVLRLALAVCLFLNGAFNTFVHSLALALLVWPSSPTLNRVIKKRSREVNSGRSRGSMSPVTTKLARSAW